MKIDVLDKVKHLLVFEDEDDFYYLQILQRKKENPHIESNSRVIKNYYINSIEYLENRYDEIKKLCEIFNARAMLRLNKRSYRKVAFKTLQNIANTITNRKYEFVRKSYDKAVGQGHNDKNKKWILDIDEKWDNVIIRSFSARLYNYEPLGEKVYVVLPTKNGLHFITKPFNLQQFKKDFPYIDVHKDNPINLYIP